MGTQFSQWVQSFEHKETEYDFVKDRMDVGLKHIVDKENIHTIK